MSKGIQETKELLEFIGKVAEVLASSIEDGKVDVADGFKLFSLLAPMKRALDGVKEIKGELTDLEEHEIKELADAALSIAKKVADAF
jgi:hypothetical protein